MTHEIYIYIAVMSAVTLAIRILPITLIRREIKNVTLRSFLYYVPYVTLAVMTFPAILHATQSEISGALALIVGILAAWFGASIFRAAVLCCVVVFVSEIFLIPTP
ncbi:MAG: AzlD domain-containing protein [Selenomonadaceae bacterium]|nr:AzlD domain-containing protein [Selenomonadaceae bacterium]